MIHLKATCDKRRTKKDGTHPIVFRVTVNGKSRDISSGLSCLSKHWDYKNNSVREKSDALKILGRRVKDKELSFLKKVREFDQSCPFVYDVQDVKNDLCNKSSKSTIVKVFWEAEIERLHRATNHSNATTYRSSLMGLEKVVSMDIHFSKVNYSWLLDTETLMREKGLKVNTIFTYFKTLRTIYNRAINLGLVDFSLYPFRRFKIKSASTPPRSLLVTEMRKFFSYKPSSKKLEHAHNMGKLIFMLRGINFTDLALLTSDNVRKGRLVYIRSKTQRLYNVNMVEDVLELLKVHSSVGDDLLLDILSPEQYADKKNLPKVIRQKRKVLNKWLKKIGEDMGLPENLTTYSFRYSWASCCKSMNYSKDMISEGLGHSYGLSVTSAYLSDYDYALIDEMNQKVIDAVVS